MARIVAQLADGLTLYDSVTGAAERDALLRRHLSDLLGCPADALRFAREARGKPVLVSPAPHVRLAAGVRHAAGVRLAFSTARRASALLIATAWDVAVGADLEPTGQELDPLALAREFFTPGEAAWLASLELASRKPGFLRLWTGKEAVLKAIGAGVAGGLAEPDLAPELRPGVPLAAPVLVLEAAGRRFTVAWFGASTADGEMLAVRALALSGSRPD